MPVDDIIIIIIIIILFFNLTPFCLQAMLMTKGLMERSLHHEMTLEWVREKAKLAEEELFELRNWKVVTEQKLKLAERARDEFQKMTEELKKVSKSHITTVLMMHSVKPRPCIQSLIFHLSISAFQSQRP